MNTDQFFLAKAIALSEEGVRSNAGGPFGCVIVRDGLVIAEGTNEVLKTQDPTAHAEIVAIRKATMALSTFDLKGCVLYTSCEPCPMCLGAIYWARPDRVVYAATKEDAAKHDFDDDFIYSELAKSIRHRSIPFTQVQGLQQSALNAFELWRLKPDKTPY